MQYIELSPVPAILLRVNIITAPAGLLANWCWYAAILSRKDLLAALIDFVTLRPGGNEK